MSLIETPPEWYDDALCAQTDPEAFFPETGGNAAAKRVCAACPTLQQCRDFALARPELEGIWGGMSERERHDMRGDPTVVAERECGMCPTRFPAWGRRKYCSEDCLNKARRISNAAAWRTRHEVKEGAA